MTTSRRPVLAAAAAALLIGCGVAAPLASAQAPADSGRIGPEQRLTGNGRQLHPLGDLTPLGNFPTGSALTPDGRTLWAANSGHGKNSISVVDVASGKVTQTLPLPGAFGGVAFTPDGRRAYVSGTPAPDDKTAAQPGLKGEGGDVLHVFDVDAASGKGTERNPVALPSVSGGSGQRNSLPPVSALYPAGLAVSPDGRSVVVALQQADRAAIVDVASGAVRTVGVGAYPYGVAFDRSGRAYVSNAFDGTLSVLDVAGARVIKTIAGLGGERGDGNSQPEGMVADPRLDRLYVAVTQRDLVAVIDTRSLTVQRTVSVARPEAVGVQPTALAVDPDGTTLYVADSNEDAVAAIALSDRIAGGAAATGRTSYRPPSVIQLRAYALSLRAEARRYLSERRRAHGRSAKRRAVRAHARRVDVLHARLLKTARVPTCGGPTKLQARRYRQAVLAAVRGASSKQAARLRTAQRRLPAIRKCAADGAIAGLRAFTLIGKLPVGAYPTSVQITPDGRLLWIAGKGFGAGANPDYTFDGDKQAFGKVQTPYGAYVLDKLQGLLGRATAPTDLDVRKLTPAADAQTVPANARQAPADTVIRPGGPIKHVFYIVRENRTYDQIFGADPRGDGDPKLELFGDNGVPGPRGGITPNAHALSRSFPLLDHVFANSEVSVDGHIVTSGSLANDYVQKGTAANYSRKGKSFDFGVFPITFGPSDFVFDQAVRQGVTFRDYGEAAAGNTPFGAGRPTYPQVQANSDQTYPNNVQIGCVAPAGPGANLATCAQDSGSLGTGGSPSAIPSRFNVFAPQFQAQVASGTVPAFNYLILPNDHTNGTKAGAYSPQALIADNDLAVGQIVDLISHSSVWASSAIFVVEDDSQDGADHVDAHRMPAFVISPYARRGAVVHTRYDQYSVLRTAEILAGLKPLTINDALATPMYDAFAPSADVEGTRYTAIKPTQSITEVNGSGAPMAALSRALPFDQLDLVPQAVMDRVLWASAYGDRPAPQPGPGASPQEHARAVGALRVIARGGNARRWLRAHANGEEDEEAPVGRTANRGRDALPPAVRARAAAQARGVLDRLSP